MKNIHWHIARTYWSRPLVTLVGLAFLFSVIVLSFSETDGNVSSIAPRPQRITPHEFVYTEYEKTEQNARANLQTISELLSKVDPLTIRGLTITRMNVDDPLPDLTPFQNLEYLSTGSFDLTQDDVIAICLLPKLKSLQLGSGKLPEGALAALGQKVLELELSDVSLIQYPQEIQHMTAVRMLAVFVLNNSHSPLKLIAQVPRIEKLSLLQFRHISERSSRWEPFDFSEEELDLLRGHPTLKEVYADWNYMENFRDFKSTSLSPKRALPESYSKYKMSGIRCAGFAGASLFALLSLNLWAHFISPAAAVVPRYLSKHRRFAIGLASFGLALTWIGLMRYDFAPLPTFALVLLVPSFCSLFINIQLTGVKWLQWLMVPLVVIAISLAPLSFFMFEMVASDAVWFLDGNFPIFTVCIILIELLLIAWAFLSLPAITVMAHENYTSTPAFSPWDTERVKKGQFQKNHYAFAWMDRGTESLGYCRGSLWKMIHLWRMGNPFRPAVFLLFLLPFFGIMAAMQIVKTLLEGGEVLSEDFVWLNGAIITPISMGVIMPIVIWWQRRKSLEAESLRPVNRKELGKQLYLSLAADHWIVLASISGLSLLGFLQGKLNDPEMLSMAIIGCVIGPLWVVGSSACVLAFKRLWVIVASISGIYLFAMGSLITIAIISELDLDDGLINANSTMAIFCIGVLGMILGIALNWVMYQMTLRREWG